MSDESLRAKLDAALAEAERHRVAREELAEAGMGLRARIAEMVERVRSVECVCPALDFDAACQETDRDVDFNDAGEVINHDPRCPQALAIALEEIAGRDPGASPNPADWPGGVPSDPRPYFAEHPLTPGEEAAAAAAEELGEECASCGEELARGDCPKSKRTCGHHCNHSWSHDSCCWCGSKNCGEHWHPTAEAAEACLKRREEAAFRKGAE